MTKLEQDPCRTCGYEEGSIYCKEHCPHEAKIEQEPCGDAIANGTPLSDILGKIRTEIEQLRIHKAQYLTSDCKVCIDSQDVLNVIDKYTKESEEV